MKKILILMGRYLPGHKDGGPLRTMVNVTDALGDEYEFYIGCLDRDHGDTEAYPDIQRNAWIQVGKAKVWYVEPGGFTNELILKLAKDKDLVYLCSFYEDYGYKTLYLKRKGKITVPIVLASMGVFSKEALSQKSFKKKVFIKICKILGLFRTITWSVTSEIEALDLKREIGTHSKYIVAEDIPRQKIPGRKDLKNKPIKVVFLSRICSHKGLDMAIDAILTMKQDCVFSIYGPIEEDLYWEKCKQKLEKCAHQWTYGGDIFSEQVQETLAAQDVLILPSKSENYGHVIFEALSVGCIPVISDNTPWNFISQENAGFVSKRTPAAFAQILDNLAVMDFTELNRIKDKAVKIADQKATQSIEKSGYRDIFDIKE